MKILFIGGTGSISASCANFLINNEVSLTLLNRGHRLRRIRGNYDFIKEDINSETYLNNPNLSKSRWNCVVNWNVYSPEQALRDIELFRNRAEHYIFISTAAVYQPPPPGVKIKECNPAGGMNWSYPQKRYESEQIFLKEYLKNKFPITIIRPAHTYCDFTIPSNIQGLGYGLIRLFEEEKKIIVHNDGNSYWTLTHSDDFAVALYGLICNKTSIGEAFHITHSESHTWNEILKTYAELLGVDTEFIYVPSQELFNHDEELGFTLLGAKDYNYIFDISKVQSAVKEYIPKISMYEGIKRSIEWHKKNKHLIFYHEEVFNKMKKLIKIFG